MLSLHICKSTLVFAAARNTDKVDTVSIAKCVRDIVAQVTTINTDTLAILKTPDIFPDHFRVSKRWPPMIN
jgi:hypothetical protein